jgi:hypothetical protein
MRARRRAHHNVAKRQLVLKWWARRKGAFAHSTLPYAFQSPNRDADVNARRECRFAGTSLVL